MDEMEMSMDILTLMDEEGNEHEFELADRIELDNKEYIALVPVFDESEDLLQDSGELVVLQVVDNEGEECYAPIEDEQEFNKVADIFMKNLEEMYDFIDED